MPVKKRSLSGPNTSTVDKGRTSPERRIFQPVQPFNLGIVKDYLRGTTISAIASSKSLHEGRINIIVRNTLTHIKNFLMLSLPDSYLREPARHTRHWQAIVDNYETMCALIKQENSFLYFMRYFELVSPSARTLIMIELEQINMKKRPNEARTKMSYVNSMNKILKPYLKNVIDLGELKRYFTEGKPTSQVPIIHKSSMLTIWINQNKPFDEDYINQAHNLVSEWLNIIDDYSILCELYKTGSLFFEFAKHFEALPEVLQLEYISQLDSVLA